MPSHQIQDNFDSVQDLKLTFVVGKKYKLLSGRHLKGIYNAWVQAAATDSTGGVWVSLEGLHTILRTTPPNAKFLVSGFKRSSKRKRKGTWYYRGVEVAAILNKMIMSPGKITKQKYCAYSEMVFRDIRDADALIVKRVQYDEYLEEAKRSLKNRRKKQLKLTCDELTGEPFSRKTEFSHVRSAALYPVESDAIWNGHVVNQSTHKIITKSNVCNERDLLMLCRLQKWKTDWFEDYQHHLQKYECVY